MIYFYWFKLSQQPRAGRIKIKHQRDNILSLSSFVIAWPPHRRICIVFASVISGAILWRVKLGIALFQHKTSSSGRSPPKAKYRPAQLDVTDSGHLLSVFERLDWSKQASRNAFWSSCAGLFDKTVNYAVHFAVTLNIIYIFSSFHNGRKY